MIKNIFLTICGFCFCLISLAQSESIVQKGELGFTGGLAHYFGDLDPNCALKHPGPDVGIFYLKQYTNYLGIRVSAHYAKVGYADSLSKNEFQKRRNLDFQSNIFEFSISGEFNFFKFIPGDDKYIFTPYLTLGVGIFAFNPYTHYQGKKVLLQPLGTEGQNINYKDASGTVRKPYKTYALCMPFGMGIKYNLNKKINLTVQVVHRLTTTDYLDDVSTTYVGANKFVNNPIALALQDRSNEKGSTPIGVEGRQRGWSKQNDQYIIAEVGIAINITKYICPTNY